MLFKNRRTIVGTALGQQIDPGRQVAARGAPLVEQHDGLAKLDPIAGMQQVLIDGFAVNKRPVRRVQIDDAVSVAFTP